MCLFLVANRPTWGPYHTGVASLLPYHPRHRAAIFVFIQSML